jgi:hypothetical protein
MQRQNGVYMDNYDPNIGNQNQSNQNDFFNQSNPYQNNPYQQPYYQQQPVKKDKLGFYSLIFAIIGCVFCMVYYVAIPCCVSAIVLAVLSRSRLGRFEGKAVAGLCLAISGLVLTLLCFVMMISMLQNPDLVNFMESYMNSYQ